MRSVMDDVADAYGLNHDFRALVNPTGRFVRGGSYADTGVTGRKIVADTYGGVCRSGGGALSGKDPTKVDRSAAYMARKIACDIVRERLALRCEVQLAYAIGMAAPISVSRAVLRHQPRAAACDPPAHQQPLRPHARRDH